MKPFCLDSTQYIGAFSSVYDYIPNQANDYNFFVVEIRQISFPYPLGGLVDPRRGDMPVLVVLGQNKIFHHTVATRLRTVASPGRSVRCHGSAPAVTGKLLPQNQRDTSRILFRAALFGYTQLFFFSDVRSHALPNARQARHGVSHFPSAVLAHSVLLRAKRVPGEPTSHGRSRG